MSAKIAMKVHESALPGHLKATAAIYALFASDDGSRCHPSTGRVAWLLGKSDRSVRDDTRELRALGVLVPRSAGAGGRGQSTRYFFDVAALPGRPPYQPKRGSGLPGFVDGNAEVDFRVSSEVADGKPGSGEPETRKWTAGNPEVDFRRSVSDQSVDQSVQKDQGHARSDREPSSVRGALDSRASVVRASGEVNTHELGSGPEPDDDEAPERTVEPELVGRPAPPTRLPSAARRPGHQKHAHCGRVCLPSSLFAEFLRRRNHVGADDELRAWAAEVERAWGPGGPFGGAEPGDTFDFWRARYLERWPPDPAAGNARGLTSKTARTLAACARFANEPDEEPDDTSADDTSAASQRPDPPARPSAPEPFDERAARAQLAAVRDRLERAPGLEPRRKKRYSAPVLRELGALDDPAPAVTVRVRRQANGGRS